MLTNKFKCIPSFVTDVWFNLFKLTYSADKTVSAFLLYAVGECWL